MPERPFRPTLPSIIGPDRPPASPLDQGQVAAVQQTSTDRSGLANLSSGAAEPASQAASGGLVEWAADAEVADRALAKRG